MRYTLSRIIGAIYRVRMTTKIIIAKVIIAGGSIINCKLLNVTRHVIFTASSYRAVLDTYYYVITAYKIISLSIQVHIVQTNTYCMRNRTRHPRK